MAYAGISLRFYYSQCAKRTASADESVLTPRRTTIREERSPAVRPGTSPHLDTLLDLEYNL